ncbi:MAG: methyltransferase [Pseudomonadota bacterium]
MSLRDRFLQWRDRMVADAAFQDWAASFPLIRILARKRARNLFDITVGFVYSQVLFACVELNIFHVLQEKPLTTEALAEKIGLSVEGTDRLARAGVSLELLERRSANRYGLGELGAALLGNPSVFAMIKHHAALYEDLRDPVALLRERSDATRLSAFWNYAGADQPAEYAEADAAAYSDLMAQTQALISSEILHAYSFKDHTHLMDIGGGAGAFLCAAAEQAPELRVTLCDLPPVAMLAKQRFEQAGLASRAQAVACDFRVDPLPKGADIITLVRVLHDHDDDVVRPLLSAIREALPQTGKLLIAEPMSQAPGAAPMGDAYFGFYLWAMGRGRPRSPEELRHFLRKAGFSQVQLIKTRRPIFTQMLVAS